MSVRTVGGDKLSEFTGQALGPTAAVVTVTSFEFEYRGYVFDAHATHNQTGWTVQRRLESKANIPPLKQTYTSEGWEVMTLKRGKVTIFRDVNDLIVNCELLVDNELRTA